MPDLASFQQAFAEAVLADSGAAEAQQPPAFAVYRNTSAKGVIDALRASYPTIDALLGSEMFDGLANDYRREEAPSSPVLSDYGVAFPAWLAKQPWTSELPYLADVARLDRLWLESFCAPGLATIPAPVPGSPRILRHPATRFAWLETPALTIWQAHRDGFEELEPNWSEEGALFTRQGLQVRAQPIDRACHYLLLLCASSASLDLCISAVAEAYPQSSVPDLLHQCVAAGALVIQ